MSSKQPFQPEDQRNFLLAIVLSALLFVAWNFLVEAPKRKELAAWNVQHDRQVKEAKAREEAELEKSGEEYSPALTRAQRLALSPRVKIQSGDLTGSIALKGLRLDDLTLTHHKETIAPDSPEVTLLSPAGEPDTYFAEIGWVAAEGKVALPDEHTVWKADRDTLTPDQPVHFTWDNGQDLRFRVTIALDPHYMFTLTQQVENNSGATVSVVPYGFLNRAYNAKSTPPVFAGGEAIGVLDGTLSDIAYSDVHDKGEKKFDNASGWFGFSDKYWLGALVPEGNFAARFSYYQPHGQDRYQAQYTAPAETITPDNSAEFRTRLFAGAKALALLDAYAKGDETHGQPPIPLFDRAVDFGWFYFLTEPLFKLLSKLYHLCGNFGLAIIALTLLVKTLMSPLAQKGYIAGCKMRLLQPDIQRLKALHADDPLRLHKEIRALHKAENVSMSSMFLMMAIQLVMFLSLNKVLYVSSEMRHAPFFGWIRDLSAADPSNLFNLFGLIPLEMPAVLHLGVLPILMGTAMVLQTRMQPPPPDPAQAKMARIMPYFFTFMFANLPSGVVLYSLCSSTFSITHQSVVMQRFNHSRGGKKPRPQDIAAQDAAKEKRA